MAGSEQEQATFMRFPNDLHRQWIEEFLSNLHNAGVTGYQPFQYEAQNVANLTPEYDTRREGARTYAEEYLPIQNDAVSRAGGATSPLSSANEFINYMAGMSGAMGAPDIRFATTKSGMPQYEADYAQQIIDPTFRDLEEQAAQAQTAANLQAMAQGSFGGSRTAPFAAQAQKYLAREKARIGGELRQDQFKTAGNLAQGDVDRLLRASTSESELRQRNVDLQRQYDSLRLEAAKALSSGDLETARLLDSMASNIQSRRQDSLDYGVASSDPFRQYQQALFDAQFNLQAPQSAENKYAYASDIQTPLSAIQALGSGNPLATGIQYSNSKQHQSTMAQIAGGLQLAAGIAGAFTGNPLAMLGAAGGLSGLAGGGGGQGISSSTANTGTIGNGINFNWGN